MTLLSDCTPTALKTVLLIKVVFFADEPKDTDPLRIEFDN
ncbi:hypothetical protein MBORA_10930 [Methanobrevibacter oralis]|uniref:Uncharacterized protein n=1 Tax=Methanobrevibacter oralis TaxID=66851 RepID=A0A162FGE9_METOA|nr:hypothetical protein MBORA_10930 [Methanobrevibacter oralis]